MDQILTYMKRMVSVGSVTDTKQEVLAAECIREILKEQEYFIRYPEYSNTFMLSEDRLKRSIPYGFIKGNRDKTIILTGHYDVVGIDNYGAYQELAYDVEALTSALQEDLTLDDEARADLLSEEWLFGRGTADMKGGLASALGVLRHYGKAVMNHPELSFCNALFLAVPDEESYSQGMKGAIPLLLQLQEQYGCQYDCCIDLEPSSRNDGQQEVFLGSVGKCMPVILVQGAEAHLGECFRGISALGLLHQMFAKTELSLDFYEQYQGEACMPPTWLALRDLKTEYDVSLPFRAFGYLNVLSYERTPEEILEQLKQLGRQTFISYEQQMYNNSCQVLGAEADLIRRKKGRVLEFEELLELCRMIDCDLFEQHYQKICKQEQEKIACGICSVPQAAVNVMREILDLSGISEPVMVIGFAPIYYPAYHSDLMVGKEGAGSKLFLLAQEAAASYKLRLKKSHYFGGISDLSYCGISQMYDTDRYTRNTPLWHQGYETDLAGIQQLNIPAILLGPWGKDIHQRTERVHIPSVTEEIPHILWQMLTKLGKAD